MKINCGKQVQRLGGKEIDQHIYTEGKDGESPNQRFLTIDRTTIP
jgi:hypothetical protein